VSRLIDAIGPKPLAWIVCGRSRIAAVVTDRSRGVQVLVFLEDWDSDRLTNSLTLADNGLWEVYGLWGYRDGEPVPQPKRVQVAYVGCGKHGQHQVDGERLASRIHGAPKQIDVTDLVPRR
jgi:hypothetical protein